MEKEKSQEFKISLKALKDAKSFFMNKKVQNIILIILLLGVIFLGSYTRLQPVIGGNLIDPTTGDYTPLALDPYYFLRVSETLIDNDGELPQYDKMRYPALNATWTKEILPYSTVWIYKFGKILDPEMTLNFANVINPVVFFILGLIVFFFLVWLISKNKWIALFSTFLLSILPPYLYRTLAGFSDHESIGMFGLFLALTVFYYGLKSLDENKNIKNEKIILIGFLAGFLTMFAIAGWGGGAKFIFMILPLSFLIRWLTRKEKNFKNNLLFYSLWILGIFLGAIVFNYGIIFTVRSYMLNTLGILTLFTWGYVLSEYFIKKVELKNKKFQKTKAFLPLIITLLIGAIFYQIISGNIFAMILSIFKVIIYPFGTGRVGLTVAENAQPYLKDLIGQISKPVFYIFLLGCLIVGIKISQGIKKGKFRKLFYSSFFLFVLGILYSRFSSSSIFNGTNFTSKSFFFLTFLIFAVFTTYIYSRSEWEIKTSWIFIFAWMIPMILSVRSAIRVFFAIVPFIAFIAVLSIFELHKLVKKNKDEFLKFTGYLAILIILISLILASITFTKTTFFQSKGQGPSYNSQWQNSMQWVRENTAEGSIFIHWWDYGYWVQTGGNRPTVTDGGHFNGYWDHLIARYLLTTPYPETAKSLMKTHNVSYLLIDPTDIGKYTAYSSIGDGLNESDRYSYLSPFISNPSEIQETSNSTIRLYRAGIGLDSDVIYEDYYFPREKSYLLGVLTSKSSEGKYSQPHGVYIYNGKQYKVPLRYLYIDSELIDFESGIESTAFIFPRIYDAKGKQSVDYEGAMIYLSNKARNSLVAKLYLMNDPEEEYSELELVHQESYFPGVYYYNGFQGPIKIWEVKTEKMQDILINKDFFSTNGDYGKLDDLIFKK